MKSRLFLLCFILFSLTASSQSISCDQFCVTNIGYNLAFPEGLVARILFTGDSQQFINYPYVIAILDENGDTLATGDIFYFGQISNTVQDYPVMAVADSFETEGFTGTVVFHFDTITCELPYPCATSAIDNHATALSVSMQVVPNPVHHEAILYSTFDLDGCEADLINFTGQVVQRFTDLSGNNTHLDIYHLSSGLYFLSVKREGKMMGVLKLWWIKR
jgi:hypothetical protein